MESFSPDASASISAALTAVSNNPSLRAEIAKDGNPGVRRLSRSQPLVSRDVCLFEYPGELLDPDVAFVGVGDPHLVRPFDHVCMSGAGVGPVETEPLEPLDELAARDRDKPATHSQGAAARLASSGRS